MITGSVYDLNLQIFALDYSSHDVYRLNTNKSTGISNRKRSINCFYFSFAFIFENL